MPVKTCAVAIVAAFSLISVSAYAEDKDEAEEAKGPVLVADVSHLLATGIPTPTPRASALAEEQPAEKIRRTEDGIRIIGVPFFPIE